MTALKKIGYYFLGIAEGVRENWVSIVALVIVVSMIFFAVAIVWWAFEGAINEMSFRLKMWDQPTGEMFELLDRCGESSIVMTVYGTNDPEPTFNHERFYVCLSENQYIIVGR